MSKERILVILSIIFILLLFPLSQVSAVQPYMGGYFDSWAISTTNKVLLMVNYQSTEASEIPQGKWLGGVLSVAGSHSIFNAPSGWVYQNMVTLSGDNSVKWAPQAWYGDDQEHYTVKSVGTGDYIAFYERMDVSSETMYYKLYAYPTFWHFDYDTPVIHTWDHSTDDVKFIVGDQSQMGLEFRHFQFGVESNSRITETHWEELNDKPSYYTGGNWLYQPARVCHAEGSSLITWIGDSVYGIGGETYDGVNIKYTADDQVCWYYRGCFWFWCWTVADDKILWSEGGIVSDFVSRPYQ
jgi:hypothetical protein